MPVLPLPSQVIGPQVVADVAGHMAFNVQNPRWGGARGDGLTDDTTAIQNAINAAQSWGGGGVVYFPVGDYRTSAPLVVSSSDILLLGTGSLATMGGGGYNDDNFSAIRPLAGWSQGNASAPAAVLFDSSLSTIEKCGIERLAVIGGAVSSGTLMHGIATLGPAGAFSVTGCIVGDLTNSGAQGITNLTTGYTNSLPTAQGASYIRNLVQNTGGDGFNVASGDMTMDHCHAQGCGGNGISINTGAGDTRISNCRADLSGLNGYYLYVPASSSYGGMVCLSNCTTQRNADNGIKLANTASSVVSTYHLANCVFQGDGTAGGGNAGIRLSGPVAAYLTGCGVTVNNSDPGGPWPLYAITTASDGVSAPVAVYMIGGFYNSITAFSNKVNAPLISTVSVHTVVGGKWNLGTPNLTVAL